MKKAPDNEMVKRVNLVFNEVTFTAQISNVTPNSITLIAIFIYWAAKSELLRLSTSLIKFDWLLEYD